MRKPSVEKCSWYAIVDEPLVKGLSYAPKFNSPQIIMPGESCDGKWHMFFHSWIGIHHFVSDSGLAWQPRRMIEVGGHCPGIYQEDGTYYLLYEKHNTDIPFLNQKRTDVKTGNFSRIEMRTSTDLISWSKPRLLLDSRNVPSACDYLKHPRLYNPQLLKTDSSYRLYFGSSRVVLDDTSQSVPRYFGCAFSDDILGPFEVRDGSDIILASDGDDRWTDIAVGSIRMIRNDDLFYAFECGAFWDASSGTEKTALHVLESEDGFSFRRITRKPLLVPAEEGWADGYITGCDVHYKDDEKCWYCYFSANTRKQSPLSLESIGLLIGASVGNNAGFDSLGKSVFID